MTVDYDESEADHLALYRLRLARRNHSKRIKELDRAEKRLFKSRRKLVTALDEVEARGLDQLDPRSLDE